MSNSEIDNYRSMALFVQEMDGGRARLAIGLQDDDGAYVIQGSIKKGEKWPEKVKSDGGVMREPLEVFATSCVSAVARSCFDEGGLGEEVVRGIALLVYDEKLRRVVEVLSIRDKRGSSKARFNGNPHGAPKLGWEVDLPNEGMKQ